MQRKITWSADEEKCKKCGKIFKYGKERFPSKMDDERESYYCCPYCGEVAGTLRLQGNEEVVCEKI